MQTWNERLAEAIEDAQVSKNSLAERIGVTLPTLLAWVGAGHIKPTKKLAAEQLYKLCDALQISAEWLLFGIGEKHAAPRAWPFSFSLEQYNTLTAQDRQEIEMLVLVKLSRQQSSS